MALSNAERQRRYRETRNALAKAAKAGIGMTLPGALIPLVEAIGEDSDYSSVEEIVAGAIFEISDSLYQSVGVELPNRLDEASFQPTIAVLGGPDYLRAVEEWAKADVA